MRVLAWLALFFVVPLFGQESSLRIRVVDPAKATIAGAEVVLLDAEDKPVRVTRTNESGDAVWVGLSKGAHRFEVRVRGFLPARLDVTLAGAREVVAQTMVQLDPTFTEKVTTYSTSSHK